MRPAAAVAALVLFASSVAAFGVEGWREMRGKPCPPLTVTSWLNTAGARPSVESLKGSAWILEFFGGT